MEVRFPLVRSLQFISEQMQASISASTNRQTRAQKVIPISSVFPPQRQRLFFVFLLSLRLERRASRWHSTERWAGMLVDHQERVLLIMAERGFCFAVGVVIDGEPA
jgi:hypothetical protein